MPIQGMAAANMLVCNSMMQSAKSVKMEGMPCHEALAEANSNTSALDNKHNSPQHQSTCKSSCGVLCASLCAMTALPNTLQSTPVTQSSPILTFFAPNYTSITLASLQRPPIFFS